MGEKGEDLANVGIELSWVTYFLLELDAGWQSIFFWIGVVPAAEGITRYIDVVLFASFCHIIIYA